MGGRSSSFRETKYKESHRYAGPDSYLNVHSMPIKAQPFSVKGKMKNNQVIQYRYYDDKGYVKKDIDLTNHGNPKEHPVVPHVHDWKKEITGGKIKLRRNRWRKLTNEELKYVERWHKKDE